MEAEDEDLARGIARRDPGAFDRFFDRYAARLLAFLEGMLRDRGSAEDLVQETMVRVWEHIARYRETGAFRAWVFRIAGNLALSELRRRKYRAAVPLDGAAQSVPDRRATDAHDRLEREELAQLLEDGLEELPFDQRAVLLMRTRGGMTLREVAIALRVPEGTVKSRMHHAVRRLREFVDRRDGADIGGKRE